jgi:hypothetical protein
MCKAKWMGQLTIGVLLSTAGFADEANSPVINAGQATAETITVESLLTENVGASRLQLRRAVAATPYANNWQQAIADVEFQDNSAMGRVSGVRNLSLLTLAESRGTRLFLGVNDDGLVGLHFIAVPKHGDRRYLSLARMPR